MSTQDFRTRRLISIASLLDRETNYGSRGLSRPICRSCERSDCLSRKNMRGSASACSTSSIGRIIETSRTISIVIALANSSTASAGPFTASSYLSFDHEADHQERHFQFDYSFVDHCV